MIHIVKPGYDHVVVETKTFYHAAKWLFENAAAYGGGVFHILRVEKRGRKTETEFESEFETEENNNGGFDLL